MSFSICKTWTLAIEHAMACSRHRQKSETKKSIISKISTWPEIKILLPPQIYDANNDDQNAGKNLRFSNEKTMKKVFVWVGFRWRCRVWKCDIHIVRTPCHHLHANCLIFPRKLHDESKPNMHSFTGQAKNWHNGFRSRKTEENLLPIEMNQNWRLTEKNIDNLQAEMRCYVDWREQIHVHTNTLTWDMIMTTEYWIRTLWVYHVFLPFWCFFSISDVQIHLFSSTFCTISLT